MDKLGWCAVIMDCWLLSFHLFPNTKTSWAGSNLASDETSHQLWRIFWDKIPPAWLAEVYQVEFIFIAQYHIYDSTRVSRRRFICKIKNCNTSEAHYLSVDPFVSSGGVLIHNLVHCRIFLLIKWLRVCLQAKQSWFPSWEKVWWFFKFDLFDNFLGRTIVEQSCRGGGVETQHSTMFCSPHTYVSWTRVCDQIHCTHCHVMMMKPLWYLILHDRWAPPLMVQTIKSLLRNRPESPLTESGCV